MRRRNVVLVLAVAMCVGGAGVPIGMTAPVGPQHSARYLVAAKLARGIRRFCTSGAGACALRGQAWVIEDVGYRERLSPAFIVGAAMTESSGGDAACGGNPKNIYGLASCGSGWHVPTFRTWRESFTFFARFVHRQWPHARTAYDLPGYSACWSCWGARTALWMGRLGFGPGLAYGS